MGCLPLLQLSQDLMTKMMNRGSLKSLISLWLEAWMQVCCLISQLNVGVDLVVSATQCHFPKQMLMSYLNISFLIFELIFYKFRSGA